MKNSTAHASSLRRRSLAAITLAVAITLMLAGCGAGAKSSDASSDAVSYPMTLKSPYGSTELKKKPTRVAVVDATDLDIALSLGVMPVTAPKYGDAELDEWEKEALTKVKGSLKTYDSTDGVNFEAIAAAKPDVILATSGWTLDKDYSKLSKIAPVVSYQGKDGISSMTWEQRTKEAAHALDLVKKGDAVIADVNKKFKETRDAHPELKGKSFTYAVIHPEQITYESHKDSDVEIFTKLGLVQPKAAAKFSLKNSAVSRENLDVLDADILLVGYPFGDEGLMTQDKLETDPLFTKLKAVSGHHYAVIGDDLAYPLAYPTPLSEK